MRWGGGEGGEGGGVGVWEGVVFVDRIHHDNGNHATIMMCSERTKITVKSIYISYISFNTHKFKGLLLYFLQIF